MSRIVSADLAYRTYRDTGIAVLDASSGSIECAFVDAASAGLVGEPDPAMLAEFLATLCSEVGATVLLLDGPQAWKDPANGREHSRLCEAALHTPAKTGVPGVVKPANYLPFVAFSIAVFNALAERGWPRYDGAPYEGRRVTVESFPMSAWKRLGISMLPAKARSRPDDLTTRLNELTTRFPLRVARPPNHDELQALVAGLAGIGLLEPSVCGVLASGVAPYMVDGLWREGLILNPLAPTTTAYHSNFGCQKVNRL